MIIETLPRKSPPVSFVVGPTTQRSVHSATIPLHHEDTLVFITRLALCLVVIRILVASNLLLTLGLVERPGLLVFLGVNIDRTAKHFRLHCCSFGSQ